MNFYVNHPNVAATKKVKYKSDQLEELPIAHL